MGKITGFEELREATAWRAFECWIRTCAIELGYGIEAADWVVQDIRSRPLRHQYNADIGWEEVPEKIREAYQEKMAEWLLQIVKLECELWAAKFAR